MEFLWIYKGNLKSRLQLSPIKENSILILLFLFRLSSSADKQQLARIKQVFEKKNQKSAQNIAQLQKKLENYQRKVKVVK